MMSKYFAALAATALVAAPVTAAPVNAASSLSVAKTVRSGSVTHDGGQLADSNGRRRGGFIVVLLAAVAVGLGIYVVADNDDNSDSN